MVAPLKAIFDCRSQWRVKGTGTQWVNRGKGGGTMEPRGPSNATSRDYPSSKCFRIWMETIEAEQHKGWQFVGLTT